MKKSGILNADLCAAIARLGHTDRVVIGDCGLPRPAGVPVIDLALVFGVPTFEQVVRAVAAELALETLWVATQTSTHNPAADALLADLGVERTWVDHEDLKHLSGSAALFIRTGEATPYANVILRCGVPF